MKKIINQTDKPLMNAGEKAESFSAISNEINKLLVKSNEQTKASNAALKNIRTSINSINKSSKEIMEKFEAIDSNQTQTLHS